MRSLCFFIFVVGLVSCQDAKLKNTWLYDNGEEIKEEQLLEYFKTNRSSSSCNLTAVNKLSQEYLAAAVQDFRKNHLDTELTNDVEISVLVKNADNFELHSAYSSSNLSQALTQQDPIGRYLKQTIFSLYLDSENAKIQDKFPLIPFGFDELNKPRAGPVQGWELFTIAHAYSNPLSRPRHFGLLKLYSDEAVKSWYARFGIDIESKDKLIYLQLSLLELMKTFSIFISQGELRNADLCKGEVLSDQVVSVNTANKMAALIQDGTSFRLRMLEKNDDFPIGSFATHSDNNHTIEYFIGFYDKKIIGIKLKGTDPAIADPKRLAMSLFLKLIEKKGDEENNSRPKFSASGYSDLQTFLTENLRQPKECVEGKVYIEFTVDKDGSAQNITIKRGIISSTDKEAIRLVKLMKFNPGTRGGKPVAMKVIMPIKFGLE